MPTGYTSRIKDGYTFSEFAMDCARAFGACVELRDECGGGEAIPEKFEPSDYHAKRIVEAEADLAEICDMDAKEASIRSNIEWENDEAARLKRLAEMRQQRDLYEAMADRVRTWVPPTEDHVELKEFMLDQIKRSIDFDCGLDDYYQQKPRLSGTQWRANRITELKRDIAYHTEAHRKDVERAAERTKWVRALRSSLEHASKTPPDASTTTNTNGSK